MVKDCPLSHSFMFAIQIHERSRRLHAVFRYIANIAMAPCVPQSLWPLRPNDNHNIRLGGTDAAVEGTWVHTRTGALLAYLNWGGSEPTNSYGNEHCINMIGDITWNGLWQDLGCFAGSNVDTAYSCEAR